MLDAQSGAAMNVSRRLGEPAEILQLRLANQHLARQRSTEPRAVVAHLGAVQSQDYPAALWALGLRVAKSTQASLECAFNSGAILRTHVLRPTWHFVTPQDIRWMLELTGPRIKTAIASYARSVSLDEATFKRSHRVLATALRGGRQLTRSALRQTFQRAGLATSGIRSI